MKAIAVVPGTKNLRLVEREIPAITAPGDIMVKMRRVGICGTDREEAAGGRALMQDGRNDLVIGHEMLGQVVETGKNVSRVHPGDYCVFTVRRGCGKCLPCQMNRADMCLTGQFRERGIWGLDGYQAEFVVEAEEYALHVPTELETVAVLTEPLSVAEKAIDEVVRVQSARLPDAAATPDFLFGRRCLVAGLGPIGLLAAMALRLRGAQVYGLDIVDPQTVRPKWLETIGGTYIDGRKVPPDKVDDTIGPVELILEATGVPSLAFNLLDALGANGIYVLTGIPGGNRPLEIAGAEIMRKLVLRNQVMIGSVNAARDHFQIALDDLRVAGLRWGNHVEQLITDRHSYADFAGALMAHKPDEIKAVIEWN
jgi:threonine dehydrogenase-like Zn-dependent dehydrogenase